MASDNKQTSNIRYNLIITALGIIIAIQGVVNPLLFLVGLLAAAWGIYHTVQGLRQANQNPALPAAPAEYMGCFAPDFRRNLEKLHQALGSDSPEMTLEDDYAFWYNSEQALELVLTPEGWLAFFQLHEGEHNLEAAMVQRAVADSPFSQHPVAQELVQKYCDMPLSGIAWCTAEKAQVYPYTSTEDFTLYYASNLFAPAEAFDTWLKEYLLTGDMGSMEKDFVD